MLKHPNVGQKFKSKTTPDSIIWKYGFSRVRGKVRSSLVMVKIVQTQILLLLLAMITYFYVTFTFTEVTAILVAGQLKQILGSSFPSGSQWLAHTMESCKIWAYKDRPRSSHGFFITRY